ncbi:hypothetical protein [Streptomyces melanogenes]|uniref:Uncharacterized protein n=1 Tax=Streptomyces melanogenes TaxID=67326 RepID=A0ABZ1XNX1_9ACTN|nr:hypothetical protein [Streptomyces melanogenes]
MPDTAYAWFTSLSDSVSALGAAAREHRAAGEAARSAARRLGPNRLLPVDLHENACLAYAYGAAESVRLVCRGERPRHIEMRRHDGLYVLPPTSLLPDLTRALAKWPGNRHLSWLRAEVMRHEFAASVAAEDDPSHDYPTDHEPSEVFPASEFTANLADSAYAYGEVAESALNHLLLAARANHFPEEDAR